MTSPPQAPHTPSQQDPRPSRPQDATWLWVFLLLALIVVCSWWVLNQSGPSTAMPQVTVTASPVTPAAEEVSPEANPALAAEATPPLVGKDAAAALEHKPAAKPATKAAATKPKAASRAASSQKPAADRQLNRDARPLAGNAPPQYPRQALRSGSQGTVLVRAEIGSDGIPGNIVFARRSGDRLLDKAAMTAVRDWRFQPALRNGKPIVSAIEVPIQFVAGN